MDNSYFKSFAIPSGTVTVIDEGSRFQYGTKQRISTEYVAIIKNKGYTECIYAGPVNAMGAFALAYGCEQNKVKATLFLIGTTKPPHACGFSNLINIKLLQCSLQNAEKMAEDYVNKSNKRFLVPFGIKDPLYVNLLKSSLQNDVNINNLNPGRMWLAVGSGTLLSILLEIYPNTHFMCVQVGKSLRINELSDDINKQNDYSRRITTFWSPEKFTKPAEIKPPYNSLDNYDAKIWRFVLSNGLNGDFIWNVAGNFTSQQCSTYQPVIQPIVQPITQLTSISVQEINIKMFNNEIATFNIDPNLQSLLDNKNNSILTFYGKDGTIYLVKAKYNRENNQISVPE